MLDDGQTFCSKNMYKYFNKLLADDTHVKVHWWNTSDDKASHNGPVVQALSILIKWKLTE